MCVCNIQFFGIVTFSSALLFLTLYSLFFPEKVAISNSTRPVWTFQQNPQINNARPTSDRRQVVCPYGLCRATADQHGGTTGLGWTDRQRTNWRRVLWLCLSGRKQRARRGQQAVCQNCPVFLLCFVSKTDYVVLDNPPKATYENTCSPASARTQLAKNKWFIRLFLYCT